MAWQVEANNAKGDFTIEVVESHDQAKIRHRELLAEKDSQGMLQWGYVRSRDMDSGVWAVKTSKGDTIAYCSRQVDAAAMVDSNLDKETRPYTMELL